MNQPTKSSTLTKPQETQARQVQSKPTHAPEQDAMLGLSDGQMAMHNDSLASQSMMLDRLHPAQRTAMVQRMMRTHSNSQIGRIIARSQDESMTDDAASEGPSQLQLALARFGVGADSLESMDPSKANRSEAISRATDESQTNHANMSPASQMQLGTPEIVDRELDNGQMQRTQRISFSQTIARSESTESEATAQVEEPFSISDLAAAEQTEDQDSVSSTFAYASQITEGGAGLTSGFGITSSSMQIRNITVTPQPGVYVITGEFFYDIKWEVQPSVGPTGQIDIENAGDADIHAANYQLVAKDLTPNMGDLNGRPPREKYWAKDLTERHELFHANDRSTFGQNGATAAQNWLSAQTANAPTDIMPLIEQALNVGMVEVSRLMNSAPGKEERAYGDGAPEYQARADAIQNNGDAGGYGNIQVHVTANTASGDAWFAGADEVYVKLEHAGKTHTTPQESMNDGDSKTFIIEPNQLFTDNTNTGDTATVEVREADVFVDDSLVTLNWTLPNDAANSDNEYDVEAELA